MSKIISNQFVFEMKPNKMNNDNPKKTPCGVFLL